MKSVMPAQHNFSQAPSINNKQRSVFNRSHGHKSTFNSGDLVPFIVDEILPGDSIDLKANIFGRLSSTFEFPIMDNLHLDTFYFFVPNRILWDNWEKFMGAQDNPTDSIDFEIPQITDSAPEGSLSDYFGLPINVANMSISSLWHRAYIKIWNDWFRDENLQDSLTEYTDDGPQVIGAYPLQKRGKRRDYFTSCLPWPQKGEAVGLPIIGGTVDVMGDGTSLQFIDGNIDPYGLVRDNSGDFTAYESVSGTVGDSATSTTNQIDSEIVLGIDTDPTNSGLTGTFTSASAVLINDLRLAVATQQFLELNARSGTRYVELIKSNFGVVSPDYRLQRPEYLGGSTQMININPVTQTSATQTGETAQGEQTAFGTMTSRSGFSKSFTEHGVIIGMVNVRADLTYQEGIPQMFSRKERLDFYFPTFANIGEQAVLNKEIFYQNLPADEEVFGYQEAWSSYRYKQSQISGRFRSQATDSLDAWHLSQDFVGLPALGSAFITENVPLDRVLTSTGATTPEIIFDSYIEMKHARVMPVYSVPGLGRL